MVFLKLYFPKVYFSKMYFFKVYFSKVYFSEVYFLKVYFLKVYFSKVHFPHGYRRARPTGLSARSYLKHAIRERKRKLVNNPFKREDEISGRGRGRRRALPLTVRPLAKTSSMQPLLLALVNHFFVPFLSSLYFLKLFLIFCKYTQTDSMFFSFHLANS